MLLGSRKGRSPLLRHVLVGAVSLVLVYSFYLSYGAWGVEAELWPDWSADHPFWRSWAHAAFVLLFLALVIGPAAKLWSPLKRYVPWRRELGIWFSLLGAGHAWAIWDRWAQQDVNTLFGLQEMEALDGYILARPEVGIMNMMMLVLAPMVILLAITSFDKAVSFVGISAWKWLHASLIHAIFYIIMLRGILYFFFFFQYSPPNFREYPSIWFLYPFIAMGVMVVVVQAAALVKTILRQRRYAQEHTALSIAAVIGLAVLFAAPMASAAGAVVYLDSKLVDGPAASAPSDQPMQGAPATTFYMVIRDQGQEVHLWASDIDSEPYFRQRTDAGGTTISEQLYRFDQKTLYIAESGGAGGLAWRKQVGVAAEDLGLSNVLAGPGVWAAQYGPGEREIQLDQGGVVQVNIVSVNESLDASVFAAPKDAVLETRTSQ